MSNLVNKTSDCGSTCGITSLRWKKTHYRARIFELKQQISILENEKQVKDKPLSYMEGLKKTEESHHYNDTVRAAY